MKASLIADLPMDERPRERLLKHGVETLSDAELVALLIGSGVRGKNAIEVGRELLHEGLSSLARRDWSSTAHARGIGTAKAARLAATFELGRRLAAVVEVQGDPIRDTDSIARPLAARYAHHVQERLGAIYLDAKSRIIREREIYVGTLNCTTVSTRDVLRGALEHHAASVIIFHNHPSGDPSPSAEDLRFTQKMVAAADLMGVELVDHLILGRNRYVSLKQRGFLRVASSQ